MNCSSGNQSRGRIHHYATLIHTQGPIKETEPMTDTMYKTMKHGASIYKNMKRKGAGQILGKYAHIQENDLQRSGDYRA